MEKLFVDRKYYQILSTSDHCLKNGERNGEGLGSYTIKYKNFYDCLKRELKVQYVHS